MERTRTELRVLTPAYASPEQVRGEKMTTVSDVYSLGVLLYELLAGHRPYRADGAPPHEMARVICQQEPVRPSVAAARLEVLTRDGGEPDTTIAPESVARDRNTQPDRLRRQLEGDLDNIVLMALRKEPQRRYGSAEQLSADIQRHLDGLPVSARKDTFSYRSTKFIKRHRRSVVAALLILLALTAGLAATAWEARVARAQRARADRRFNDVRKLAHSNLFELHDAIANLPGSTPARELLVKRALEYFDSLAQESGDDPSLQREIVSAYLKVGNVLGNPNNANLGDSSGALQSYGKALSVDQRILAANPADGEAHRLLAVIYEKMSDVQAATGNMRGAVDSSSRSLSIFREIATSHPAESPAQISLAISHIKWGDVMGNPDFPNGGERQAATESYRASLEILERLSQTSTDEPKIRHLRGLVYERLGTMLATQGQIAEASDAYQRSLAIREGLASENPTDVDAIRDVAIAYEKIGSVLEAKGDLVGALESRRKSLSIFRRLVEADQQNVQARQSLALSYLHLGDLLINANVGNRVEAQQNYRMALEVLQHIGGADAAGSVKSQELLESVHRRLGTEERSAGK
jgi:non-specific serine/threonine protein kinase/serine/threonine-protein kinase